MASISLNPGEVIILREESCYNKTQKTLLANVGELVLTNQAIYFVKKNMLGRISSQERYELSDIQMYDNQPQAKVEKEGGANCLAIYMNNGDILKFQIGEAIMKMATQKWVDAISKAVTGHEGKKEDYVIPGMKTIANYASGTIGIFKSSLGIKDKEPEKVVKYCENCGSQISGIVGEVCECPYCGTKKKL